MKPAMSHVCQFVHPSFCDTKPGGGQKEKFCSFTRVSGLVTKVSDKRIDDLSASCRDLTRKGKRKIKLDFISEFTQLERRVTFYNLKTFFPFPFFSASTTLLTPKVKRLRCVKKYADNQDEIFLDASTRLVNRSASWSIRIGPSRSGFQAYMLSILHNCPYPPALD